MSKKLSRVKQEVDQRKRNEAALTKKVDALEEKLARLKKSKWALPTGKRKKSEHDTYCRLAIPDTHGCYVHPAVNALLDDMESFEAEEVVWLGDHLECGGFLAEHHTEHYVAQSEYSFEEDVSACNQLLDRIQTNSPQADHHFIEGNHERRLYTWCMTQGRRKGSDVKFLLKHVSAPAQLHLDDRGIQYYRQGEFYGKVPIPSTLKLGHCYFTHGHSTAKHAASVMLSRFAANVVFGHIHRAQESSGTVVDGGVIRAWCPGCLCKLQPLWQHTAPTDWSHGYGLQVVHRSSGKFLHINVPIIDGESYLLPFADRVARKG